MSLPKRRRIEHQCAFVAARFANATGVRDAGLWRGLRLDHALPSMPRTSVQWGWPGASSSGYFGCQLLVDVDAQAGAAAFRKGSRLLMRPEPGIHLVDLVGEAVCLPGCRSWEMDMSTW